ncbi:unnamed protein product [Lathyrus oleraceus]
MGHILYIGLRALPIETSEICAIEADIEHSGNAHRIFMKVSDIFVQSKHLGSFVEAVSSARGTSGVEVI